MAVSAGGKGAARGSAAAGRAGAGRGASRGGPPAKGTPRTPGWGLLDLGLVGLVVLAVFTRTPLGGLGQRAWGLATGQEVDAPALLATFSEGPDAAVLTQLAAQVLAAPPPVPDGEAPPPAGFPEPYRSAARLTLTDPLPPAALALGLPLPAGLAPAEQALLVLDHLYTGDPEAALERFAVGEDQRRRAILRARPHHGARAERFEVHRRFLPAADARRAEQLVGEVMGVGQVLGLAWPIAVPHRVSSGFGYRVHPVLGTRKLHNGVDLSVPIGTPVLAAQQGEVAVAAEDRLNGLYVVIDHGFGVRSSYCHLDRIDVARGQALARGEALGRSGNTGRSTGPHLHFTLKVGGEAIDPAPYRPADAPVSGS